jgi:8-oxo-dGTP pyrophosphatase MutT (NUDIX family)
MTKVRQGETLPEQRTSVRVILVDPEDRVLLLGARDPVDNRVVWVLPGGGVEGNETLEEAARRELAEECALHEDIDLIGPVWKRLHRFNWDGRDIEQSEWYFVARLVKGFPVEHVSPSGQEAAYFIGARWGSVTDLQSWDAIVAPRKLAQLLPSILAGDYPTEPIDTGV